MSRSPHAQLHLPALSPDEALVFVNVLDRLIAAIWRAHGPAMSARLDELHSAPPAPASTLQPPVPDDDLLF